MTARRIPRLEVPRSFGHVRKGIATVLKRARSCYLGEIVDGDRRALATWSLNGAIVHLTAIDAEGRWHGLDREIEQGVVVWQQPYRRGVAHGVLKQFNRERRVVMTSRFENGTGVDVYCDDEGRISEAREIVNGLRHGLEIHGSPVRPYSESRFSNGMRHGVFRVWEKDGTLRSGSPAYFVNDIQLTSDEYHNLSAHWPALPRDRRKDDANQRSWPHALFANVTLLHDQR